jgi:hypothetical protein
MTPTKRPKLSTSDQTRLDLFILRLEWHLEGELSGRDRKDAVRALREEVSTDPRGVKRALADLGVPSALATRYGDDAPPRPLWSIGIITAASALVIWWALFLCFTGGMLAAVDNLAPAEANATFALVDVTAFSGPDGIGIGWTSGIAWLLVPTCLVLLAFVLGSRSWRLVTTRRPASLSEGTITN